LELTRTKSIKALLASSTKAKRRNTSPRKVTAVPLHVIGVSQNRQETGCNLRLRKRCLFISVQLEDRESQNC
jgi:hypothetical protein